jgi:arsenate reductase (thioredoxin)
MTTGSDEPIRVLFLCTGNSARSQMAEAFLRALGKGRFAPYSAGTEPAPRINPLTIEVMRQIDISLDGQRPKSLDSVLDLGIAWDYVITTCDEAAEACPTFPGDTARIHWGFRDPAKAEGTEEERLRVFRRVRDEIKRRVQLFTELNVHNRAGVRA